MRIRRHIIQCLVVMTSLLIQSSVLAGEGATGDEWWDSLNKSFGTVFGDLSSTGNSNAATPEITNEKNTSIVSGGSKATATTKPGEINPVNPDIAALIREWISNAEPPANAKGANLHYDKWGRVEGRAVGGIIKLNGSPDNPVSPIPEVHVWAIRNTLDSINLCSLEEYVVARINKTGLEQCVVSESGPVRVAVIPDMADVKATTAKQRLVDQSYKVRVKAGKPAPTPDKAFTVDSISPRPGSQGSKGQEVDVTVFVDHQSSFAVPDMVGLSARTAKQRLIDQGFKVRVQTGKPAPTPDKALTVESINPVPGSHVASGAEVTLLVYPAFKAKSESTLFVLDKVIFFKFPSPSDLCKETMTCKHSKRVASGLMLEDYYSLDAGNAMYIFKETHQSTGDVRSDYSVKFRFDVPPARIHAGDVMHLKASGTAKGFTKGWYLNRSFTYYIKKSGNKYFKKSMVNFSNREFPNDGGKFRGNASKKTVTEISIPKNTKKELVIGGKIGWDPAIYIDWYYKAAE